MTNIAIVGNSVPLLVIPNRSSEQDKTYAEILRQSGFNMVLSAKQGVIISDLYKYLEDEVICTLPDYIIFNFGVVESMRRARPRWLELFLLDNVWNNSIIDMGYNSELKRAIKFIFRKLYLYLIEYPLFKLGISWRWLSPSDFEFIYKDIINLCFQMTSVKKIILLSINSISVELEKRLPGSQASVIEYNKIQQKIAESHPDIIFIDTNNMDFSINSADGIHFSSKAHALIADQIKRHLSKPRSHFGSWEGQVPGPIQTLYRKIKNKWTGTKK